MNVQEPLEEAAGLFMQFMLDQLDPPTVSRLFKVVADTGSRRSSFSRGRFWIRRG